MTSLGRNHEMSLSLPDLQESLQVVETVIDQNQILFPESGNQFPDESVIGSRSPVPAVGQGSTTGQVEGTGQFHGYRPQSFLAAVGAETFPEGGRFRKPERGVVDGQNTESAPAQVAGASIQTVARRRAASADYRGEKRLRAWQKASTQHLPVEEQVGDGELQDVVKAVAHRIQRNRQHQPQGFRGGQLAVRAVLVTLSSPVVQSLQ